MTTSQRLWNVIWNEFNLNKSTALSWSCFLVPFFFQNGPIVAFNSSNKKLEIMFWKEQITTFQMHPFNHEIILNTRQSSVPTTLLHPFETGCMFCGGPICHYKSLLEVDAEMTQDVTVKKRHVIVLSCTPIKRTFSVHLCHVTCVQ